MSSVITPQNLNKVSIALRFQANQRHGTERHMDRQTDRQTECSLRLRREWVSEQILNGTSAQLGYTVPFTAVYARRKYVREDKSKTDISATEDNAEKANNTKHSRTKLAWFSRFLQHSASKWGGLILHTGLLHCDSQNISHRQTIQILSMRHVRHGHVDIMWTCQWGSKNISKALI